MTARRMALSVGSTSGRRATRDCSSVCSRSMGIVSGPARSICFAADFRVGRSQTGQRLNVLVMFRHGGDDAAARAQGPRGHAQPGRPVRAAQPRGGRRRLGQPRRAGRRPGAGDRGAARTARARSSPTTTRRTSRSTSRSTPTAAASMAASTATPGRATAISAFRPGSTSRPGSSSSTEAAALLRQELARPGYVCKPISLGANTDPYQPLERRLRITRQVLEVLAEARHPVGIVTKSALVTRDIDLLAPMARDGLARVYVSVTTLDAEIARTLEPRAAAPHRRLAAVRALAAAGITTGVMVAPIIPALTDHEIEPILTAAADAGAASAGYVLVRLPHEVKDLMAAWLEAHFPGRAAHVLSLIRQCRDGRLNDPEFGSRMRGAGSFAELIAPALPPRPARRHGFDRRQLPQRTDLFRPPRLDGQLDLFARLSRGGHGAAGPIACRQLRTVGSPGRPGQRLRVAPGAGQVALLQQGRAPA